MRRSDRCADNVDGVRAASKDATRGMFRCRASSQESAARAARSSFLPCRGRVERSRRRWGTSSTARRSRSSRAEPAASGRATVELFAQEGAKVVVADVSVEEGEALAGGLGDAVAFKRTDVSDGTRSRRWSISPWTRSVVFTSCSTTPASPSSFRRFLRDDLRDYDRVMAVNLFGVIIGTQRAGRYMAEHGGGSIINTSSIGGLTGGGPPSPTARPRQPSPSSAGWSPRMWLSTASG